MTRTVPILAAAALALTAACQPPAEPQAALPDSATVHAALQAGADAYEAAQLAGDAAATAALYTEDGTAAFEGSPTTTGRAALQALTQAAFDAGGKPVAVESVVQAAGVHSPTVATAGGSASFTFDSAGVRRTDTWRWAAEYQLEADGVWRISYIIAFREAPAP